MRSTVFLFFPQYLGPNPKAGEMGKKPTKKNSVKPTKAKGQPGRPRLYSTPEKLQKEIDKYFAEQVGVTTIGIAKDGTPITQIKAPTISGLNYFLGFCERTSLDEYAKDPKFYLTVKRAKLRIHQFAEQQLFENGKPTGAIFWLKNNGWRAEEQKDVDVSCSISSFSVDKFLEKFDAEK